MGLTRRHRLVLTKKLSLFEGQTKMKLLRNGRNVTNALILRRRCDRLQRRRSRRRIRSKIQLFHMMKKTRRCKKIVELTMLKSLKSYQMIWVRKLELPEEDDEEEDSLKTRKKNHARRGTKSQPSHPAWIVVSKTWSEYDFTLTALPISGGGDDE